MNQNHYYSVTAVFDRWHQNILTEKLCRTFVSIHGYGLLITYLMLSDGRRFP